MTQREVINAYTSNGSSAPWAETRWLGKQLSKCPMDLWTYQEILWDTKPDVLIECGTGGGGSALFFANVMDLMGRGEVVTIDVECYDHLRIDHPRITWLQGISLHSKIVARVMAHSRQRRTMVVLDSDHRYENVEAELETYAHIVSPGCYIVVEDTGMGEPGERWADQAVREFLAQHPEFKADQSREKQVLTLNPGGWLRRVK